MNITWNKNIEPEHKSEIESYLRPVLFLIPGGCQNLHINLWDGSNTAGEAVSVKVDYDYHCAVLHFNRAWLNLPKGEKRTEVIHQLMQIHALPVAEPAEDDFARRRPLKNGTRLVIDVSPEGEIKISFAGEVNPQAFQLVNRLLDLQQQIFPEKSDNGSGNISDTEQ
jgi:hypothetical protein